MTTNWRKPTLNKKEKIQLTESTYTRKSIQTIQNFAHTYQKP